MRMEDVLTASPVIAVLTLTNPRHAAPLARALLFGGAPVMEVTLRTPAALECVRIIANEAPEAIVGASTVLNPKDFYAAHAAGAAFIASPGASAELLDIGVSAPVPYLPGVSSASELMAAYGRGYDQVKLFPAAPVGGVAMLRALAGPFPGVTFCATGGVTRQSAPHYLAQSNVLCVGGSWLAPQSLIEAEDWDAIEQIVRATVDDLASQTSRRRGDGA